MKTLEEPKRQAAQPGGLPAATGYVTCYICGAAHKDKRRTEHMKDHLPLCDQCDEELTAEVQAFVSSHTGALSNGGTAHE